MSVPPIEGIVLLFIAGRRIPWQIENIGVALITTATAAQFVVPYAGIEGHVARDLAVDIEISSNVLVPRTIVPRADATTADNVSSMES